MSKRILQIGAFAVAVMLVAGCQTTQGQREGTVTGAAIGTGVGLLTGGTFAQVVGAGLIGGGSGFILGDLFGE